MTEPSDEEIRYLLTKRALVVDVLPDLFGRPVVIVKTCIEAVPRLKGEANPPGTLATVDPDGKINVNDSGLKTGACN